jgi:acetyltransferase
MPNSYDNSLSPFFTPQGIAVVGVSRNPTKLGYGLARNLVQSNFRGAVHFVNPKGGHLFGNPIYCNIADAPAPIDLAIILIPASAVPRALRDCGERGIRAAIIASGGFRETGKHGAELESECIQIAKHFNMRLLGPNCIGLLDTHLPLDATFLPPPGPLPGEVAFISHSGAICAAVIDWARGQGFGLSRLVSLGNQVDVNETDVLAPVAADRFTRVLTLYLEAVSDGRRFVSVASQLTRQKPIIAIKVGRSAGGQRAVESHTGAMAGQESAFNAAFRRAGVIRADTSEEMFDWARALAWCNPPNGRAIAVLTNAGGPGATAADAIEAYQLRLTSFSNHTRRSLRDILPAAASLHNPVDMLATATPEQYARCLAVILDDPGVDAVMVILPPPPMHTAGAVAKALIPVIHDTDKPVIIALMGEKLIQEAVEHFRAAQIPEYRFPERAASALAVLAERTEYLQLDLDPPAEGCQVERESVAALLAESQPDALETTVLAKILSAYGITVAPSELATSPEGAIQQADQFGFPVALKIASPDILHKSDIGGVLLNLMNSHAVAEGYEKIMANASRARPEASLRGIHVQKMLPPGQEIIIGALQDPQFGPMVMFGSGGVEVEKLGDVAFALAPVSKEEASYLLDKTWAGKRLYGYRHLPPADREAVLDVILRLGQLAADFPQITEIEINPLQVMPKNEGAFAIDVRGSLQ